jgi:histidinol phosphatase-like PHP family hydrolase
MVKHAIDIGMETLCLTEHMPRWTDDLYPEEVGLAFHERLNAPQVLHFCYCSLDITIRFYVPIPNAIHSHVEHMLSIR